MIRYAIPLAAAAILASPAAAANIEIATSGPVVELSITESVKARPDIATIGAGVTTLAPTAVEAMRANAKDMNSVIDRIKALGIAKDDIQTTGISLNAQYDYDRTAQKQVFRGYRASNQVSVVLRDLDDAGKVLDALVAAGATDLSGPNFSIEDDTKAKAAARKAAVERARAQAMEYAEVSGYKGIRLLEISEAIRSTPQPMMRVAMDMAAEAAPTPVEPGLVAASVSISVKYEMTQ